MNSQNQGSTAVQAAHAVRFLSADAVQRANSGHPGMPLGMADIATVLWSRYMRFNPTNPRWLNRDRFVLSNGHGSMLLYSLLHLTGYALPLEQLRQFRQMDSATPGHPEYGHTPGVEVTSGPLGQGIANAVGLALAERRLAARFNRPGNEIIGHQTYVFAGDGCLMEGISHEACSLAGHLKLGRLILFYDDNQITIDGSTELACSDDAEMRFRSYGWATQAVDGHDHEALAQAIAAAQADTEHPTLIRCRTVIGWGSPNKAGTAGTHGSPLGDDEIAQMRTALGWKGKPFEVPEPVLSFWREAGARGAEAETQWKAALDAYANAHPQEGLELRRIVSGEPCVNWREPLQALLQRWRTDPPKATGSRSYSAEVIAAIAPQHADLVGGSADLTGSNLTIAPQQKVFRPGDFRGSYVHYGIREHAMAAIMNGLALHGGVVPYAGTFLTFSDYMRPALRLAALMGVQVLHVLTHDSIGLGEDGPTHQPVEHYAALRVIPGLRVYRPADACESAECWLSALEHQQGPSALLFSRHAAPPLPGTGQGGALRGGYLLADAPQGLSAKAVLLATGTEVNLAMQAREQLAQEGLGAKVVSLPCWELFMEQPEAYRRETLSPQISCRVGVESGLRQGWDPWLQGGRMVGMTGFGASAPAAELFARFKITAEAVAQAVREQLGASN